MRTERIYGWHPDRPDHRDLVRAPRHEELHNLPSTVDLRSQMPPVYDQQQIGSCTANAIAAAFEADLIKQQAADYRPSRLFIYYNERAMEGSVGIDAGAQIRDGIKTVAKLGVVSEDDWPYDGTPANSGGSWPDGHRAGQRPSVDLYTKALEHQALVYERVVQEEQHIKAALAAGFPVVYGFTVYASFESEDVARTGLVPMPGDGESELGGHAVTLVGYDDATREYLGRNSWGTDWGQAGYYRMPYDYVHDARLCSDFWTLRRVEG